jgi:hypothetical protein
MSLQERNADLFFGVLRLSGPGGLDSSLYLFSGVSTVFNLTLTRYSPITPISKAHGVPTACLDQRNKLSKQLLLIRKSVANQTESCA